MVYYDKEQATVTWDAVLRCVILVWHKYIPGEAMREAYTQGLDLMKQKRGERWISDLRNFGAMKPDDENWMHDNYLPRAKQAGLRHVAAVLPTSAYNRISAQSVIEKAPLKVEYFSSMEAAKEWIGSK